MKKRFSLAIFGLLALSACKKKDDPQPPVSVAEPSNFPPIVYDLSKNPVTDAGFELGRRLFYDPIFSRDSSISCADCHLPQSAFSHVDHITSHGIDGLLGKRNAPAVQNMAWSTSFFWDGGVPSLDLVPLNAIQNPVEMDESPARVVQKLNRHATYPSLFRKAFPDRDTIDGTQMLRALSQFMAVLVSADSRYDRHSRGETGADLTAQELSGLSIFQKKCTTCHSGELFTDQTFRNNGILADFTVDKGRFEVSGLPDDVGKFKVPSLRNVAVTFPFMHNGRKKTLEDAVEHYASGVKDSPTLDPLLKQNGKLGIELSAAEKADLVAFLKTLTDPNFSKNPLFQSPF